jgi:hypothetical protein
MIHVKHLVIYWYSKGHKADTTNDKLKDHLVAIAPLYSTVTSWCRKLKLKYDILVTRRGPGRPPEVYLDDTILDAFNEFSFHSLRSLSRVLKRPLSTIRDHLIRGCFAAKHLKFSTGPHPLFSPDLALFDFYLFGTITGRLRGRTFQEARELLETISEVSRSIRFIELQAVFRNWEDRLRRCIELDGEYMN